MNSLALPFPVGIQQVEQIQVHIHCQCTFGLFGKKQLES